MRQVPPGDDVVFFHWRHEAARGRVTSTSGVDKVGADHAITRPRS